MISPSLRQRRRTWGYKTTRPTPTDERNRNSVELETWLALWWQYSHQTNQGLPPRKYSPRTLAKDSHLAALTWQSHSDNANDTSVLNDNKLASDEGQPSERSSWPPAWPEMNSCDWMTATGVVPWLAKSYHAIKCHRRALCRLPDLITVPK